LRPFASRTERAFSEVNRPIGCYGNPGGSRKPGIDRGFPVRRWGALRTARDRGDDPIGHHPNPAVAEIGDVEVALAVYRHIRRQGKRRPVAGLLSPPKMPVLPLPATVVTVPSAATRRMRR